MSQASVSSLPVEWVDPRTLLANPLNFREHPLAQRAALSESISEYGWLETLLVNRRTGRLINGHARLELAIQREDREVPCWFIDVDERTEAEILLIYDKIGEMREINDEKLLALMTEVKEFNDGELPFAWTEQEFEQLLKQVKTSQGTTAELDEEDIPDIPDEVSSSRVVLGECWQLGRHKLVCGDCRDDHLKKRLFEDRTIDQVLSDPPYGVDYQSKNAFLNKYDKGKGNETPIINDDIDDYEVFFTDSFYELPFSEKNTIYIFIGNKRTYELLASCIKNQFYFSNWLIWVKNNHVVSTQDYSNKHEMIWYGWKGRHEYFGDFSTTILEYPKPTRSELHPTMKPIPLVSRLMTDGSEDGDLVYDPFLGSGTTLLCAERLNRICYGFEIDPNYCEVICQRFEELTGIEPAKLW